MEQAIDDVMDKGLLPPFVVNVDGPHDASAKITMDHSMIYKLCDDQDQGRYIDVDIQGDVDGPYSAVYKVRVSYDSPDAERPSLVGVRSPIHHFALFNGLIHQKEFYKGIMQDEVKEENVFIRTLLQLEKFFAEPLHPCPNCDYKFYQVSRLNREREETIERYRAIALYPILFEEWQDDWFDPRFLELIGGNEDYLTEESDGVFSFPMFTDEFCNMLIDETEHFEESGLPVRRPNSMNNYGIILNEIGMADMFTELQSRYLQVIASRCFPEKGASLDLHHSFLVKYTKGEDLGLDMHVDDSDITFNVCLGKEFTGADLVLCGMFGKPDHRHQSNTYSHLRGRCLVHLGSRRHGAQDIESGERVNLIVWNKNFAFRGSAAFNNPSYEKESSAPDEICLSYTHDKDYTTYKALEEQQIPFAEKA